MNVHSRIIYNYQKVETTLTANEQMNEIWYTHMMAYYSAIKILLHATTWNNLKNITLSETKPDPKSHILYDSIYI